MLTGSLSHDLESPCSLIPLKLLQYVTRVGARGDALTRGAHKGKVTALGLDRRKSDGNTNKLKIFPMCIISCASYACGVIMMGFCLAPRSPPTANQTRLVHIRLLHAPNISHVTDRTGESSSGNSLYKYMISPNLFSSRWRTGSVNRQR